MRRALWVALLAAALAAGCAETVRCPDGQVFDDDGECAPIPDAGPGDAGSAAEADGG